MFCFFLFLALYARTTRYEEAFFSLENQGKKARFAHALHDNLWGPRENDVAENSLSFIIVFMVDMIFELTTNDPWSYRRLQC